MHDEDDEIELKKRLKLIHERGVNLYMDGEPASPEEIARKFFVNEDADYMPDFVTDDNGALTEVRYDKVKDR